jgi:hypothetical protein
VTGGHPRGRGPALLAAVAVLVLALVGGLAATSRPAAADGAGRSQPKPPNDDPCPATEEELGGLLSHDCFGPYPSDNYDIGYDGGGFTDFSRKITGWWTDLFFSIGKTEVQLSLWSVDWAYDFDIQRYDSTALAIGDDYETNITKNGSFHLYELAWLILAVWVGIALLIGRGGMAVGELVLSILLVMLATTFMAHRGAYMDSTWHLMDAASADILVAGQSDEPTEGTHRDVKHVVDDVQAEIHNVFVEQPYDYLNWGRRISDDPDDHDRCRDARNQAVATGPHESDDKPRDLMEDAGCDREAEFQAQPSMSRLTGAIVSMISGSIVSVVLLALALTVVFAKFAALVLFAVAPFAMLTAVLPGGGRRLAWLWLTTVMQVVLAVVGMSFLLSLLLIGLQRLLDATANVGLVERFFIVNAAVLAIAMTRRRILASGEASAGRLADNLTNTRVGGGGQPWEGPRGSRGINFRNIDKGMLYTGWGAGTAVAATAAAAGRVGGFMVNAIRERAAERRRWHNTVKARIRGDHWAASQTRTYISSQRGGMDGPGPRGGYLTSATPSGIEAGIPGGDTAPRRGLRSERGYRQQLERLGKGTRLDPRPRDHRRQLEAMAFRSRPGVSSSGPRIVQEQVINQYRAGWGMPVQRAKDKVLNHYARRRGIRDAQRAGLLPADPPGRLEARWNRRGIRTSRGR